jgi:carboxyl-terminal processing protease
MVLLVGLVIGHAFSGYVVAQTGSTYEELEIFSDALGIVQSEYVKEVDTETLVYGALQGMLNELDAHSQFMVPDVYRELKVETEGHFGGLGIVISLDENKVLTVVSPIEDTPASRAGILAGDRIIEIEGESTNGLVLEEAVKMLRGPKGSEVTITVLRLHENHDKSLASEKLEFTLVRDDIKIPSVKERMLDNDIAYIRLAEFNERSAQDLRRTIKKMKSQGMRSLILDLRLNPGGLLNIAVDVADIFIEKGKLIVYTESRSEDQNMRFKAKQEPLIDPGTPIVILVNGGSASASEIVAGALRDWRRAVILGQNTFGKGSVQSIIPLNDGSALRLTTAEYLTPNGHSIDGVGIVPDIVVKMSKRNVALALSGVEIPVDPEDPESAEEIVDVQLQRAVELLQGYDIFKTLEQNIDVAKEQIPAEEEVEEDTPSEAIDMEIDIVPDSDEIIDPEIEEEFEETPETEEINGEG